MGNPGAQDRGLEEGLSRSEPGRAERPRTRRWKLDCEINRAAAWQPVSIWSAVEHGSRTEGKQPPNLTQGHAPPPLGLQRWPSPAPRLDAER